MDRDTFIKTITDIGTCEDDVERRTMLVSLQDEAGKLYDSIDTDKTTINSLNEKIVSKDEEISKLQKHNMDLFLQVGVQKTPEQIRKEETGLETEKPKRKFEDLFDEKGMIK